MQDIEAPGRISTDERAAHQLRDLDALLERLRRTDSQYWRDKLGGVTTPGTISDVGQLPFTVKQELRNAYPLGMLAVPQRDVVRVHASSGTRGKPTIVAYTAQDVAIFAEVNARALAMAGATREDTVQVAYGYGLFTGGLGLHYGVERLGATAVPASGGNVALQLQLLADLAVDGLCATPSFAMLLAERAAELGVGELRLRCGVFGAEPWSAAMRTKLEDAWAPLTAGGRFDACDIYGLSEIIGPGVAMEPVSDKGALSIFADHFLPEIVDPASGQPITDDTPGELVLTTLTKQAMPVIRYRTGDLTRWVAGADAAGRTWPRVARLTGRVDDMLIVRGVNVYPSEIEQVVLAEAAVAGQYAVVIDRRGTMAQMTIRCEAAAPTADTKAIGNRLAAALADRLRLRVAVEVGEPGSMPRQQVGKAQRVFEQTGDEDPLAGL